MKRINLYPNATAYIKGGTEAPNLKGEVNFYQKKDCVLISASINGLPKNNSGFFGFHIHEGNRCAGAGFSDTGNHYNPTNAPHPLHSGDLPSLLSCNGNAQQTVTTDRFRVEDIIGRTVVIHSGTDDFVSQPSGNAGMKIACGVIVGKHLKRRNF